MSLVIDPFFDLVFFGRHRNFKWEMGRDLLISPHHVLEYERQKKTKDKIKSKAEKKKSHHTVG